MPFDGIVMRAVCHELNNSILGGRIEKINQPDKEQIIINIHNNPNNYKLLLSANASSSRVNLTKNTFNNPSTPPNFCILLRKYLSSGRLVKIYQPYMERILEIHIDSPNDIGDVTTKIVVIEVMGKHSNIMLLNHNRKIIDSLKHIDFSTSRLREILPGRDYCYPATQDKSNPLDVTKEQIMEHLSPLNDIREAESKLVSLYTGISPFFTAKLSEGSTTEIEFISSKFHQYMQKSSLNEFAPCLFINNANKPTDFHAFFGNSTNCQTNIIKPYDSISQAIDEYFIERTGINNLSQKKSDLLKVVSNNLTKVNKKIMFNKDKIEQVADREKYKLYGELLTANLYKVDNGTEEITVTNYYSEDQDEITIKLDSNLSPSRNSQLFYKKFNKAKGTFEGATKQLNLLLSEQSYLENVLYEIELCEEESSLDEIKEELISEGLIKSQQKSSKSRKPIEQSKPSSFMSSNGFEIMVGRNNRQNDRLTLKIARNCDIWMHTKNIPGSHVIIKTEKNEVPDKTLEEAAKLAAWFSKARQSSNVPVDYTFVRDVKKPTGAKPGFVIYENFKTVNVMPELLNPKD
jgi:predicted ribosome quality control (RQC) complex YloA/Tae2 family protein